MMNLSKKVTNALFAVKKFKLMSMNYNDPNMFETIRMTFLVSQVFGIFPVTCVLRKKLSKIRFSWKCWQTYYFFLTLIGQILMSGMCTYRFTRNNISLTGSSNLFFYGTTLSCLIFNFSFARNFSNFMRQVSAIEVCLPKRQDGQLVRSKCNIIMAVVFLSAAVEHILSVVYGLRVAQMCNPKLPMLEAYFHRSLPWFFDYIRYNHFTGIIGEIWNIQSTFMWSYIDVIIIILSYYLTSHFNNLNKYLLQNKQKVNISWIDARICYAKVSALVRLVDSRFNLIVLISFASNLFFICLQLFNSLNSNGHSYRSAYFTFSFCFLIARTLLVSLTAAGVHSASRRSAVALYEVPSCSYNKEVERFIDQVNNSTIALSGLNFFFVTRGMILTVIGTIITYELVLLQFNPLTSDAVESANVSASAAT